MTLRQNADVFRAGTVALVGAGPGDPELLTLRAARRLAEADLVLYDALIDPEVLSLARTARRVYVGKRAGRHAVSQDFINRLLVRAARRGQRVVRLKGGDPFVFGRGGEEAIALALAGVPCEVVPGISSAVAAAALAGIPVTHRAVSPGFVVVSGHAEEAFRPVLESLAPHSATVVVMMGLGRMKEIALVLAAAGWAADAPAAVLLGASTAASTVHVTTLAGLGVGLVLEDATLPGTIVVGDVVRVREVLVPAQGDAAERTYAHGSR